MKGYSERKLNAGTSRRLYEEAAGVGPAGVTLAAASIHSRHAQQLRQAGISTPTSPRPYPVGVF